MIHTIRTFSLSGESIHEKTFETAEKAYECYLDIIVYLKKTLPKGFGVNVVRFKNEKVVTMETVIGTK